MKNKIAFHKDQLRPLRTFLRVLAILPLASISLCPLALSKGNSAQNIISLKKLTVGPYDNYQGRLSSANELLFFTQNQNLSPQIYSQSLDSEFPTAITSSRADAKDPVPSADGKHLAFTYFKFDSKGDICLKKLPKGDIKCVSTNKTVDHSPFWINNNQLGFLSSKSPGAVAQIEILDIATEKRRRIDLGRVSSPSASPNGQDLVYISHTKNKSTIKILPLAPGSKPKTIDLDLPGIPSFPSYSKDSRYLYFSHYLNDTNYDQRIDGNDNSVIFRLDLKRIDKTKVFPEQLTSVENNCSFPSPQKDFLLITCSFEGSLDLYRLPLTGALPHTWGIKNLWEAHATSRSYQDRLLILNKIRFLEANPNQVTLLQRILSNHMALSEYEAASYNIQQIIENSKSRSEKSAFQSLQVYLDVKQAHSKENSELLSRRFKKLSKGKLRTLNKIPHRGPLKKIIEAHIFFMRNDKRMASERLKLSQFQTSNKLSPLERYLAFDLYEKIYNKPKDSRILPLFRIMMSDKKLSEESRIHFTFRYLDKLSVVQKEQKRLKTLRKDETSKLFDSKIQDLILAERLSLELALNKDKKRDKELYGRLDEAMNKSRKLYFLRRASYIRSILILSEFDKLEYMNKVASNWLRYTKLQDMEFHYASAQYTYATMDKAYGEFARKKDRRAFNIFYRAIRQTDDLEAHYGYFDLGFTTFAEKYSESLASLEERDMIGDSRYYNQALKLTLQGEATQDDESYDKAISTLKSIDESVYNPAMKYLLLAYNYQRKLDKFDSKKISKSDAFKKAHKYYMIALYEGKDNFRIKASILSNLSLLHQSAGNHSLAANFFEKRSKLPFTSPTSHLAFYWQYSRSLFFASDYDEAAKQSQKALMIIKKYKLSNEKAPFVERLGFYAMNAGQYNLAKKQYRHYLKTYGSRLTPRQKAKAKLALGYTYMKRKEHKKAAATLKEVIEQSKGLKFIPKSKERLLAYHPARLRILANGFLADQSKNSQERIQYRTARIEELKSIIDKAEDLGTKKGVIQASIIKDYNIIADVYDDLKNKAKAQETLETAVLAAKDWSEGAGDPYSVTAFKTMVNYLSYTTATAAISSKEVQEEVESVYNSAKESYQELKTPAPMQTYQFAKLKILWKAYQVKQGLKGSKASFTGEMDSFFKDSKLVALETKLSRQHKELAGMRQKLESYL